MREGAGWLWGASGWCSGWNPGWTWNATRSTRVNLLQIKGISHVLHPKKASGWTCARAKKSYDNPWVHPEGGKAGLTPFMAKTWFGWRRPVLGPPRVDLGGKTPTLPCFRPFLPHFASHTALFPPFVKTLPNTERRPSHIMTAILKTLPNTERHANRIVVAIAKTRPNIAGHTHVDTLVIQIAKRPDERPGCRNLRVRCVDTIHIKQ